MRNEEPPKAPKKVIAEKGKPGVLNKRQTLKRKYSSITMLLPKVIPLPYCHDQETLEYKVSGGDASRDLPFFSLTPSRVELSMSWS